MLFYFIECLYQMMNQVINSLVIDQPINVLKINCISVMSLIFVIKQSRNEGMILWAKLIVPFFSWDIFKISFILLFNL